MASGENVQEAPAGQGALEEIEALTGVSFASVMEYVRGEQPRAAWTAGSLVEGLGHANSDIDIFLVVENLDDTIAPTRRDDDVFVRVEFVNARRVDFEYWTARRVDALAAKLAAVPIGDASENVLDYFREPEIEFMHRLHTGIPLVGHEAFEGLRRAFDRQRLKQYLIENKRLYLDDAFDDAVGLLEYGHLTTAVFRARYAVDASVDLLLFSHGITNDKEKQRVRLFHHLLRERPELSPVYEKFWKVATSIPESDEGMLAYVEDALRFSEEIVDIVQKG